MELNRCLNKHSYLVDQIISINQSRLQTSRAMLDATIENLALNSSQNI